MNNRKTKTWFRKAGSGFILLCFLIGQIWTPSVVHAQVLSIPATFGFQPPVLLGLKIHPENPLLFDFIVDQGQAKLSTDELKSETTKLVKYFLAALTIPDKEVWVNLSPTEKDRIIPDVLGQTTMGKTMLEQDYVLKQLASSLTNPDTDFGKKYWANVGNTRECFLQNKVWIMPQKAEVLESNGIVLVGEKRLKVMMAEDYELPLTPSLKKEGEESGKRNIITPSLVKEGEGGVRTSNPSSQIFRTTILPVIEKEVNEGKDFADVRQIYNSVILAAWYKKALKESLLGKIYTDKSKVAGVETDDKAMKQRIYDQYLEAFKKGAYNLIKEEESPDGETIPRKYFSGGIVEFGLSGSSALTERKVSFATIRDGISKARAFVARVLGTERDEGEAVLNKLRQRVTELPQDFWVNRKLPLGDLDKINAEGKAGGIYSTQDLLSDGIVYKVEQDIANGDIGAYRFHRNEVSILAHLNSANVPDVPQLLEYGNVARNWRPSKMSFGNAGDFRTFFGEGQPVSGNLRKWFLTQIQAINDNYSTDHWSFDGKSLLEPKFWNISLVPKRHADVFKLKGAAKGVSKIKDFVQRSITTAPYMKLQGLRNARSLESSQLWNSYSFRQKLVAFISFAQIIDRIHRAGVIHNDIRSANLLISEQPDITGSVMVIDFSHSLIVGEEEEFLRWMSLGARHKNSIEGDLSDFAVMMWQELDKSTDKEGYYVERFINSGLMELLLDVIYPDGQSPKNMEEIIFLLKIILSNIEQETKLSVNKIKMWQAYEATKSAYMDSFESFDKAGSEFITYEQTQHIVAQIKKLDRFLGQLFQNFLYVTSLRDKKNKNLGFSERQYYAVKTGLNSLGLDFGYDNENGFSVFQKNNGVPETRFSSVGVAESQTEGAFTPTAGTPVGGIDFDPSNMNLQIKRDGRGVPLPLPQQNLQEINIQGLFPVIINITPINTQTLPIFFGAGT